MDYIQEVGGNIKKGYCNNENAKRYHAFKMKKQEEEEKI